MVDKNKKNKAFSIAETLIVMMITGILLSLSLPVIKHLSNHDKYLYRSAVNMFENIIEELSTDTSLYPNGINEGFKNTYSSTYFCNNFVDRVNILKSSVNCSNTDPSTQAPAFITTNGMRWWGFANTFENATTENTVYVDVNGSKNPNTLQKDILRINVNRMGRITIPASGQEEVYMQN